jgi:hypothetical protein
LQPHCKGCCNHLYCHQVATTSSKHQPSCNLTVSWLELFLNWFFLQSHVFTCFFATVFFAIAVTCYFCNCFFCNHTALRVQSHCDKVAITHMLGLATVFLQS